MLIRSFAQQPHAGCVKAVGAHGKWLASGSSDECIKYVFQRRSLLFTHRVFDLAKRREFGSHTEHRTTVTTVSLSDNYLLAGDDDGEIRMYRVKDWECIRTLKSHTYEQTQTGELSP